MLDGILVCGGAEMHITSDLSLIYCFLLCLLIRDSLSIPANVLRYVRNLTTRPLSLYALDSSLNLPLNATSRLQEPVLRYHVPNTYVVSRSLFLRTSGSCPETKSGSYAASLVLDVFTWRRLLPRKGNTDLGVTTSEVTIKFELGFPVDKLAMHDTIDAARK